MPIPVFLLKGSAKGNNEELEALTKVADLFEEITTDKAAVAKKNKPTRNVIRQYSDNSPRVEENQSPRVGGGQFPRVPDWLVAACM